MALKDMIKRFEGRRVLVVGDLILDCFVWGRVNRISPEAPVPVVEVEKKSYLLGGAANVGRNIVALGGRATVLGALGDDRPAERVHELCRTEGIECLDVRDDRPTTLKTRVIAHSQQVVRFDHESREKLSERASKTLIELIKEEASEYDAIIISDYKKGVVSRRMIHAVLSSARKGALVALDPKVGNFPLYKGVSIITPNIKEASEGSGIPITGNASLIKAGKVLIKRLNLGALLVTRGEDGMSLFEKGTVTHIPTLAKKVFDVTGAGDTVIAALALARAAGASLEEAALIANHAAGIVVGEVGTAVATPQALRRSIGSSRHAVVRERL